MITADVETLSQGTSTIPPSGQRENFTSKSQSPYPSKIANC